MNVVVLILLAVALIYFVKGVFSGKDSDFFIWLIMSLLLVIVGIVF